MAAAEHHDAGLVDRAVAGGSNVDSIGPVQLQNMRLLIDTQYGPMVIPLTGHLILHNSISPPPEATNLSGTRQNVAPGNVAGPEEQAVVIEPSSGNGSRLNIKLAADEPEPDEDAKYLDNMRGWLMTVAALFVGIAFQAAIQPPQWVLGAQQGPEDDANTFASGHAAAPSPLSAAAHQRATKKVTGEDKRAKMYYIFNALAFTEALSLLLVLVLVRGTPAAAGRAVNTVKYAMPGLFFAVGSTFFVAMSTNGRRTILVCAWYFVFGSLLTAYMLGKLDALKEKLLRLFRRR